MHNICIVFICINS